MAARWTVLMEILFLYRLITGRSLGEVIIYGGEVVQKPVAPVAPVAAQ